MPSQKLMLCNYNSKYTKKILEGFYVIRTTEDDDDDDVGWSLSLHLPPLCQPIWCGVGLLHHGCGGGGFIDEVMNLLLVMDFFHP